MATNTHHFDKAEAVGIFRMNWQYSVPDVDGIKGLIYAIQRQEFKKKTGVEIAYKLFIDTTGEWKDPDTEEPQQGVVIENGDEKPNSIWSLWAGSSIKQSLHANKACIGHAVELVYKGKDPQSKRNNFAIYIAPTEHSQPYIPLRIIPNTVEKIGEGGDAEPMEESVDEY